MQMATNTNMIILHSSFIPEKDMKFSKVQKTAKGQKIVFINLPSGGKVRVQTPVMRAPFGLSTFNDAQTGSSSMSLDLSFNGYETNERLAGFMQKCRDLDEVVLDMAQQQSEDLFGKSLSKEILQEFHRPVTRDPSDPKYAPTVRLKITPYTEVYDENHQRCDPESITKGATVRAIIEPSFWIVNKSFGVSLRIVQLAIVNRPAGLSGFAFADDDDDGQDTRAADGMQFLE